MSFSYYLCMQSHINYNGQRLAVQLLVTPSCHHTRTCTYANQLAK